MEMCVSLPQPFRLQFQPQPATRALSDLGASNIIFSDNVINKTIPTCKNTRQQKVQNYKKKTTQHLYTKLIWRF